MRINDWNKMDKIYTYQEIWEHQCTILYIANYRFEALKCLKSEYDRNNKATYHRFIRESMYVLKESVIINLCKLFITPQDRPDYSNRYKGVNSRLNFYYNINHYKDDIGDERFNEMVSILESVQIIVDSLIISRDKEIAHKDLKYCNRHNLNVEGIEDLELLINTAKTLISFYSYHHDLTQINDKYSNPNWVMSTLEALNFYDSQKPEVQIINNLKNNRFR